MEATAVLADEGAQVALDLAGVGVFALSGGLLAVRRGFDAVGILVLAVLTGLGGGLLRDVLIGDVPPAALRDTRYLATPFVAAVVVFLGHRLLERIERAVLVFDAAGLGFFAVAGTLKALAAGLGPLQATVLGTISAVGGGVLRDVVAWRTPELLRADSTQYATPAFAGAAVIAATAAAGRDYEPVVGLGVVAAVFAWRVAAIRFGWRAPTAPGARRQEG